MKRLPTVARALAFASLAAMLAGCKTVAQSETTGGISHDYRLRHPIAVREGKQTLTVFIGDRRGGLTPLQRTEVAGVAPAWRREATGGLLIEVPVGGANERAAAGAAREIRAILSANGVPGHSIEMRPVPTRDPVRLGTIRVNYPRMVAETGPCGLWPEDIGPTLNAAHTNNRPHWNHGCASQRNLAAQVAEPADLVQPRAETPVLASRRTTVLDKYRKGEATATQYPDANKGKISDVGQ
ncbi:MAG TPA: CpaD family pilus assembly protein [Xanthobacteraceae bacterium]|nr:CpaD family pilus assembly protein [Xanthobacteraceae bacterium]